MEPIEFIKGMGKSKFKEKFAEYAFLKEFHLQAAIANEIFSVSRSDFDSFGYDLLIHSKARDKLLYVQLKSVAGKASNWDIHKDLLKNEDGRIILIKLGDEENTIKFKYLLFDNIYKDKALKREAKNKKEDRCKTNIGEYTDITKNIISIFNDEN